MVSGLFGPYPLLIFLATVKAAYNLNVCIRGYNFGCFITLHCHYGSYDPFDNGVKRSIAIVCLGADVATSCWPGMSQWLLTSWVLSLKFLLPKVTCQMLHAHTCAHTLLCHMSAPFPNRASASCYSSPKESTRDHYFLHFCSTWGLICTLPIYSNKVHGWATFTW